MNVWSEVPLISERYHRATKPILSKLLFALHLLRQFFGVPWHRVHYFTLRRFALGLWAGRISCSADESGHILTLSHSGHIRPAEMKKALQSVQALAPRLKPGFVVLSDLTNLDSMEPACAADLGAIAEQLSRYGISSVISVIPDPAKDIGFNIVSIFHFRQPVKVHTRDSLAEAIKCLLLTECAAVTADS